MNVKKTIKTFSIFMAFNLAFSCGESGNNNDRGNVKIDTIVEKDVEHKEKKSGLDIALNEFNKEIDSVVLYLNDRYIVLDKFDFYFNELILFNNLRLSVPSNWIRNDYPEEELVLFKKDVEDTFIPSFTVERHNSKGYTVDEFVGGYIESLKKQYTDCSIHKMTHSNVNNISDVVMFNCSIKLNENKIGMMFSFYKKGDDIYIFSGTGLNNKKDEMLYYSPIYEEIIWSFSFDE